MNSTVTITPRNGQERDHNTHVVGSVQPVWSPEELSKQVEMKGIVMEEAFKHASIALSMSLYSIPSWYRQESEERGENLYITVYLRHMRVHERLELPTSEYSGDSLLVHVSSSNRGILNFAFDDFVSLSTDGDLLWVPSSVRVMAGPSHAAGSVMILRVESR